MLTITFWRDAAERAVATAAQAVLALISVAGLGLLDVDWAAAGSVAGLAALASLLKALVASQLGDPDSASLVDTSDGRHSS